MMDAKTTSFGNIVNAIWRYSFYYSNTLMIGVVIYKYIGTKYDPQSLLSVYYIESHVNE